MGEAKEGRKNREPPPSTYEGRGEGNAKAHSTKKQKPPPAKRSTSERNEPPAKKHRKEDASAAKIRYPSPEPLPKVRKGILVQ